ncbi:unnamed protein product [Caenorhabditis brenneri]
MPWGLGPFSLILVAVVLPPGPHFSDALSPTSILTRSQLQPAAIITVSAVDVSTSGRRWPHRMQLLRWSVPS